MRGTLACVASLVAIIVAMTACSFRASEVQQDTGVISDGPPSVTVGFLDTASMADRNSGTVMVPVVLSAKPASDVTVRCHVLGGTATLDSDFTFTDQTLTFSGLAPQACAVTMQQTTQPKGDTTIILQLDMIRGPAAVGAQSTHTITLSAQILPRVTFVSAAQTVGEGSGSLAIAVALDTKSPADITVHVGVGVGSATTATGGGVDFSFGAGGSGTASIVIPMGQLGGNATLTVVDDALDEPDETIELDLLDADNAVVGLTNVETVTIADNDSPPTVAFTSGSDTVSEGVGSAFETVTLSAISGRDVTVPVTVTGGNATAGTDFTLVTTTVTIPAGSASGTVEVDVIDDTLDEDDETLVLSLGTPTNATLGGTTTDTITITDNDLACFGPGSGSADAYDVCEDRGPSQTVTLAGTLSTDDPSVCAATQPIGWTGQGQPDVCLVIGTTVTVPAGGTVVTGTRPLVIVASVELDINGLIDASGSVGAASAPVEGPGVNPAVCGTFGTTPTTGGGGGGGGGAGGSFITAGSNGGTGDAIGGTAGTTAGPQAAPTVLRAGCDGQLGASSSIASGAFGGGGGAVYLTSPSIVFAATGKVGVDVSGGGAVAVNAGGAGGGGGGSGGMLKLFAQSISFGNAHLLGNGGGAGGGSGPGAGGGALGKKGADPDEANPQTAANGGGGGAGGGGVGGKGAAGNATPPTAGAAAPLTAGGGGGGGGAGYLETSATAPAGNATSFGTIVVD